MDRMVKADGEASKAQADANKAQKALRQLELDVDALRLRFSPVWHPKTGHHMQTAADC